MLTTEQILMLSILVLLLYCIYLILRLRAFKNYVKEIEPYVHRYQVLRHMHWSDNHFTVVKPTDVKVGSQTYRLELLDDNIDDFIKSSQYPNVPHRFKPATEGLIITKLLRQQLKSDS